MLERLADWLENCADKDALVFSLQLLGPRAIHAVLAEGEELRRDFDQAVRMIHDLQQDGGYALGRAVLLGEVLAQIDRHFEPYRVSVRNKLSELRSWLETCGPWSPPPPPDELVRECEELRAENERLQQRNVRQEMEQAPGFLSRVHVLEEQNRRLREEVAHAREQGRAEGQQGVVLALRGRANALREESRRRYLAGESLTPTDLRHEAEDLERHLADLGLDLPPAGEAPA